MNWLHVIIQRETVRIRSSVGSIVLLVCACNVYDESLLSGAAGAGPAAGTGGAIGVGGESLGRGGAAATASGGAAGSGTNSGGSSGVAGSATGAGGVVDQTGVGGASGSAGSSGSSGSLGGAGSGGSTGMGGLATGSGGAGGAGGAAGTGGSPVRDGGSTIVDASPASDGATTRDSASPVIDADAPPAPACPGTETKGGACTTATPEGRSCFKACGPDSVGYKLETCSSGAYVEGDCGYLQNKDYACYKLPLLPATPPTCAAGTQATMPCAITACMPCGPTYLDSTGAAKDGYCVCNAASMKWTCGSTSTNSWPCSASQAHVNPGC